jgi:catechol 2,3-dioxygenase
MSTTPFTMPEAAHVGRVGLRVGSLDDTIPFYRDVVGLDVDRAGSGATLAAAGTPLVDLVETPALAPQPSDAAGLFHLAVRVPTRAALGDALARIEASDVRLTGASDHLVSEALYLRDPEGNGVEIYCDRPREAWTFTGDRVEMDTLRLDLDEIRTAATGGDHLPDGTDIGHVHLEVTDLQASRAFYVDALGLNVRTDSYDGALFVAAGDYHHHVGLNTWNRRQSPAGESHGLDWFEFVFPTAADRAACVDALDANGVDVQDAGEYHAVDDPDAIAVRLRTEARE